MGRTAYARVAKAKTTGRHLTASLFAATLALGALMVAPAARHALPLPVTRIVAVEPALRASSRSSAPEWQYRATRMDRVPASVRRAAAGITIAVIDTGADLRAPDVAAKAPELHTVVAADANDVDGHGTFVAALAAGSDTNGEGIAGFGGSARLLVVRAVGNDGTVTDAAEAAAIRYAVDRGARIINLSIAGAGTSEAERAAVEYAASRGVLLVAAAGNEFARGNAVQYPAALLQPVGSNGIGGVGLVVGASNRAGRRAQFSGAGSWISLAAPGSEVLSDASTTSSTRDYHRIRVRGSRGVFATASGTSFAAPQVAGAAALVWAANPALTARQVADLLERTASRRSGGWNPELGWGVLDAGAAVAAARSGAVS